ncbi:MAG: OPT family oligopeptide transporter [Bdellovibrionales bacterium]
MENTENNQKNKVLEFTFTAVAIGIVVGVIMTAANVYLGLYAGMTVSASIPAAVIAMGILKALKRSAILEANIVQTMASAGESLAAGIIFTIPALVLVGAWTDFKFIPTTLIAICGGLLGVVFMIPLRKSLIIEDENLTYPEGVACSAVLEAGANNKGAGLGSIINGLLIGATFKALSTGVGLIKGSVEFAGKMGDKVFFAGSDISPALLAVGYIVKLEVALLVFIGGMVGWTIGIPLLGTPESMADASALDVAWTLWSTQIRYLGVGAMITGGVYSIFSVRKGIASGLSGLKSSYQNKDVSTERTDQNMSLMGMLALLVGCILLMFGLYQYLIDNIGESLLATALMTVLSFVMVAVSSYIVGLVGTSNNPVSGMTISALLGTAAFFLVLGYEGQDAILATLGVAAVVCCAACTSGDCSQDLKTGVLVGATPKFQQYAQVIGVIIPALVIAPVLSLLHTSYGIGDGLKAPQATLFASITQGLFGEGDLPYNMIYAGMIFGVVIIFIDNYLEKRKAKYRLYLMPLAVGIYLPVTLAVPMFLGGVIRTLVDKKMNRDGSEAENTDNGVLISSGLIAGEALMGVFLAVLLYYGISLKVSGLSNAIVETLSVVLLLALAWFLKKKAEVKL